MAMTVLVVIHSTPIQKQIVKLKNCTKYGKNKKKSLIPKIPKILKIQAIQAIREILKILKILKICRILKILKVLMILMILMMILMIQQGRAILTILTILTILMMILMAQEVCREILPIHLHLHLNQNCLKKTKCLPKFFKATESLFNKKWQMCFHKSHRLLKKQNTTSCFQNVKNQTTLHKHQLLIVH